MDRSLRSRAGHAALAGGLGLLAVLLAPVPATAATGTTTRASVATAGTEADLESRNPAVTGDGRFVVFESSARNLVADDTNAAFDVFIRDYLTGVTERVSLANDGSQASAAATVADVSGDGRFVTFQSAATNLVAGDTNNANDIFVRDRVSGTTERASVASDGSQATGSSTVASISDNGRYVAFQSTAANLVAGDGNNVSDIFVRDRQAGVTTRVSVASGLPVQESRSASSVAVISADGRYVAFESASTNLVAGDVNNATDVFVHDRQTSTTTRVSVGTDGTQGLPQGGSARRPALSADGRFVSFDSTFNNLVSDDTNAVDDVFVHDRQTGITTRVSVASDNSQSDAYGRESSMSADGRHVAFTSPATNLVSGDTNGVEDIIVRDRQTATTTRISVGDDGRQANGANTAADVNADGRHIAFASLASNLVVGDSNAVRDVYVRDSQGVSVARPKLTVAVGDVSVHEGDQGGRAAVFTVSLSKPSLTAVTVDYATADISATAGTDYTARAGTLSFAPGNASLTVKVPVAADTDDESEEMFTVSLSGASGAVIADPSGMGTIVDDDPETEPGRRISIGDVRVHEGNKGTRVAVFNVSLSTPATETVTVEYDPFNGSAVLPGDYAPKRGSLSFAPGITSLPIKMTINPDTISEGNETFTVVLSLAKGPQTFIADGTGVGTILDDD